MDQINQQVTNNKFPFEHYPNATTLPILEKYFFFNIAITRKNKK